MDFDLTDEQEAFRRVVRDFAEREIAPYAEEWDRQHTFPVDTVRAMGDLGLFGLPFPEEYGGSDADFTTFCLAVEELGRVDSSMAITLEAGVGLGANPIYTYGSDEQRARWLPDLCAGQALAAFGLTEPDGGSDAGATRTRAKLDDATGDWVINGSKAFITNSGTPGLIVEPPYRKMGWHASDTHGLTLQDCRVPEANLLGSRGAGFKQFLATLDDGRVAIAALAVGLASACLEQSVAYCNTRNAFGGAIGRFQAMAFKCADLAVAVENARLLTYKAAWMKDHGRHIRQAAAMAKLYATEAAVTATREATQIFGGYGFVDETPVARFYRDAKILEIGEGTSEIQRLVISRELGLPNAT